MLAPAPIHVAQPAADLADGPAGVDLGDCERIAGPAARPIVLAGDERQRRVDAVVDRHRRDERDERVGGRLLDQRDVTVVESAQEEAPRRDGG
ncbi:MAG: hypothetical protein ACR2JQ_12925 [Mycobacteriales bacterium]